MQALVTNPIFRTNGAGAIGMSRWFEDLFRGSIKVRERELVARPSEQAVRLLQKLDQFRVLAPNWDSYGADEVSGTTIDAAVRIVRSSAAVTSGSRNDQTTAQQANPVAHFPAP